MLDFAALEARANSDVAEHLANASVVYGATAFDAVFWQSDLDTTGGAYQGHAREWYLGAPSAAFVVLPTPGATLTINGAIWRVGRVDVDASGWVTLAVNRA